MESAITPPGSTRSSRKSEKYHHGTPFWVLTTVVFSPIRGLMLRRKLSESVRLHAQEDNVDGSGFAKVSDDPRMHLEIALGAKDTNAMFLHRAQVRTAREQSDILARLGQARADIAADGAGAGDQKLHSAIFPQAPWPPLPAGFSRSRFAGWFPRCTASWDT